MHLNIYSNWRRLWPGTISVEKISQLNTTKILRIFEFEFQEFFGLYPFSQPKALEITFRILQKAHSIEFLDSSNKKRPESDHFPKNFFKLIIKTYDDLK